MKFFIALIPFLFEVIASQDFNKIFKDNYDGTVYLQEGGLYRKVPDSNTLSILGLSHASIKTFNQSADPRLHELGQPMFNKSLVMDHYDRVRGTWNISTFVIDNIDLSFKLMNAAFIHWNGTLVSCFRKSEVVGNDYILTSDRLVCLWYHNKNESKKLLYGGSPDTVKYLNGENPRIWVHEDKLHIVYNYINLHEWKSRRMMMAVMSTSDFAVDRVYTFNTENAPYLPQKNWTPFTFDHHVYFIYIMQPHQILAISGSHHQEKSRGPWRTLTATLAASSMITDFVWRYGEMRGGSPAHLVDGKYLTFFHSSKITLPNNKLRYFMGAYTFSAEPPFHMLSITATPIIEKRIYIGRESGTGPDYIIYPTSFYVEGDKIMVYYGRQDNEMWMMVLNKTDFMQSLTPVKTAVIGNSKWVAPGKHGSHNNVTRFTKGLRPTDFRYT